MKFRKLFLGLRLWRRAVTARRQYKRALLQLSKFQDEENLKTKDLIKKYEYLLDIERTKFERLHTEWANRFLQHNNRASLSNALANLEDSVREKHRYSEDPEQEEINQNNPANLLTAEEHLLYLDTRDAFYADGKMEGKTDSEIERHWQEIQPIILRDVKSQIL